MEVSETTRRYLKTHFFTFANLILLLTLTFKGGILIATIEGQITTLSKGVKQNSEFLKQHISDEAKLLEKHIDDKETHMTSKAKMELFVPRVELDSRFKNLNNKLDEIQKQQTEMYRILINK